MQNNNNRYCKHFDMSPQEFYNYKRSKKTRIAYYIFGMIFVTLFVNAWLWHVVLTLWLISSYWNDSKREEQWIKDGSVTINDLRDN